MPPRSFGDSLQPRPQVIDRKTGPFRACRFIRNLVERGRLVLVTKGDLLHQQAKLAASGLGDLFSGIEIVSEKQQETFEVIFDRYSVDPLNALMAGDSMRSDILPALEAGAWAAYIPQPLGWSHEQRPAPSDHPRFIELPSLASLVHWLDRAEAA